jgi:uncharacterized cupredoxin-like copper-binding protein
MIKYFLVLLIFCTIAIMPQMIGPKVSVQQLTHDFGDVNVGDIVKHTYIITNNGGDLLKILDVRASCGCTAAKPEKNELKPGESTDLVVTFNSKGRKGPQNKTVTVVTNDTETPNLTLSFKCNVIVTQTTENKFGAILYLPETQHDFGKIPEGQKIEYTFKVENKGTESLVIKDVKTSCGCTAAVVSNSSINPGEVGSIKVNFDTKNRLGRNSKSITIVSNDIKEPNKVLTIYADVQKN